MNVSIDCRSASGRTVVAADVPGDDEDASIAVSLDGKKSSLVNDKAQSLAAAGNANIQNRIKGGDVTNASITLNESEAGLTVTGSYQGTTIFSLASKGPVKLTVDRDYGYRNGKFTAKLNAVNQGQPFVADLSCEYDYAP
jgi:hypothetical protein